MLVNVHFRKAELALILITQSLECGGHSTTGPTPGSPKVNDDREIRLEDLRLEVLITDVKQVRMCIHDMFYSLSIV
jgi:hypothetical protein